MDAEAVVRDLCEAFSRTDVDELLTYFAPGAIYEKMPVGRFEGHDQIRGTLEVFFVPGVTVRMEILTLVTDGSRVVVERITHFETAAGKFELPVLAIFEVDAAGKVTGWRDYFDRGQAGLD